MNKKDTMNGLTASAQYIRESTGSDWNEEHKKMCEAIDTAQKVLDSLPNILIENAIGAS